MTNSRSQQKKNRKKTKRKLQRSDLQTIECVTVVLLLSDSWNNCDRSGNICDAAAHNYVKYLKAGLAVNERVKLNRFR